MSFSSFLLVAIAIITTCYLWIRRRYSYWKDRGIPYINPTFPFGNTKDMGRREHISEVLREMYTKHKNDGPFVGTFFVMKPTALVTDLELVKNVLIKDFQNFVDRGFYSNEKDDPLSAHLFSLDGARWKQLRSKMTPTFTSGKMRYMYPAVVAVGEKLKQKIDDLVVENSYGIEIREILARYTTDVIGSCVFGIDCNSLNEPDSLFRQKGKKTFETPKFKSFGRFFLFSFPSIGRMLGIKFTHDDVLDFFINIVRGTIDGRRKAQVERNDFMNIMIKMLDENPDSDKDSTLTFNELVAQAFLFFIAGFETSATTMSFTLYELCKQPKIQQKLRDHVTDVLERHKGQFTYEALVDMKYLDQVINETLRMHAPLHLTRIAENDYLVPGTKWIIPKGAQVIIPTTAIHFDPDIYNDPLTYDPNRFSEEEVNKRPACSFLAFGEGPRNCVGLRFGMLQTKIGLAMMIKNYVFEMNEKTEIPLNVIKNNFIVIPGSGLYVNVKPVSI